MLKTLFEEFGKLRRRPRRARRPRRLPLLRLHRPAAPGRSRDNPAEATLPVAHAPQQAGLGKGNLARRVRSRAAAGIDYTVGDAFGLFPTNDPALADAVIAALGAPPRFPDRRPHAARRADRRRVARRRARHAVPAVLLHHRRRAPAEGQGARRRRGPGRRRRDARRAGGDREIPRRAARPGSASSRRSIRCSRGSIRSRRRPRSIRSRMALCVDTVRYTINDRTPPRRRFDLPGRAREPRRPDEGLRAEGARLRPAGRSVGAGDHDRTRHRHRAVPRLPARAHGHQGARPQLAVLRPSAQRLRFLLRGRARPA